MIPLSGSAGFSRAATLRARRVSRALDRLYLGAGVVAAGCIVAICLLVSAQIVLNGLGRAFPGAVPTTIPSYASFAGYMLAGATFLALAHTLRAGGHVRVTLLTTRLPRRWSVAAEGAVLVLGLVLTGMLVWFMGALALESLHYGDVSAGIVPVPLALPQAVITFGLALLWLALAHTLVELAAGGVSVLAAPGEV